MAHDLTGHDCVCVLLSCNGQKDLCVYRTHSVKVNRFSLEWTVALFMSSLPEHTSTGSDGGSEKEKILILIFWNFI